MASTDGEVYVSFNKTKTLSGDELYYNVLKRQFFIIATTATGFCVGFLLTTLLRSILEYLIPKNKYYNINFIIAVFFTLISFTLISSLVFTINYIESKKDESLINN